MTKRLYVGNLGSQMSAEDLETIFLPLGTVVSVEVVADRATGVSKGFAFVEMADEQQANAASAALTGTTHSGRTLTVSPARPRTGGTNTEGGRPGRR